MGRWSPDALGRLQQAAMELFEERGFDDATVTEIAERAGLTKRTFFRYFADKREVLFSGSQDLQDRFAGAVAAAPADATPMAAVTAALDAVGEAFAPRHAFATRRAAIIVANPELLERELIKLATLTEAVAQALRDRGVADPAATFCAHTAVTVFHVAFGRWVAPGNERPLKQLQREALAELRAVTAG
jgi:AcrR family transcriptional regulator